MAKKKTAVEEVKLQDAPVLRGSPTDPETEPAAERKPWVDFIPPYVKDNAKGYPRYVDKLAEALNGVVEGGGGGGGSSNVAVVQGVADGPSLTLNISYNDLKQMMVDGKIIFVEGNAEGTGIVFQRFYGYLMSMYEQTSSAYIEFYINGSVSTIIQSDSYDQPIVLTMG